MQPDEIGGKETQAAYLVVPDADAVYGRAKAAGFPIVIEIKDESHGGRGFSCRDREGRFWNVGTYDPRVPMGQGGPETRRAAPRAALPLSAAKSAARRLP